VKKTEIFVTTQNILFRLLVKMIMIINIITDHLLKITINQYNYLLENNSNNVIMLMKMVALHIILISS